MEVFGCGGQSRGDYYHLRGCLELRNRGVRREGAVSGELLHPGVVVQQVAEVQRVGRQHAGHPADQESDGEDDGGGLAALGPGPPVGQPAHEGQEQHGRGAGDQAGQRHQAQRQAQGLQDLQDRLHSGQVGRTVICSFIEGFQRQAQGLQDLQDRNSGKVGRNGYLFIY